MKQNKALGGMLSGYIEFNLGTVQHQAFPTIYVSLQTPSVQSCFIPPPIIASTGEPSTNHRKEKVEAS
jgi:hypothetical protein